MKYNQIYRKFKQISVLHDHSGFDIPIDASKATKIYGFYHILCFNDWKRIVYEQVTDLQKTGLYDILNKIYVCVIISNDVDIQYLTDVLPEKFEIVIQSKNPKDYEYPILRYLYEKSHNEDFLCFYFHTKGVSFSENMKKKKKGSESWRLLMEYFIFEKYNVAINALQNGYTCYGTLPVKSNGYIYFRGNFWWTTSKYVTTLPEPSPDNTLIDHIEIGVNDRIYAEFWIGHSSECHPYMTYSSTIDTYHNPIPGALYKNRNMRISDIMPIMKCYLTHLLIAPYW